MTQPNAKRSAPTGRVLPATRLVAIALVPFLVTAFFILFFEARDTGEHFAWSINPPMTAVVMASGYLGGAYYFTRMTFRTEWHETGVVLPAVAVFATCMLIATLLHWDKFNHGHTAFWLWVFLYVAAPVAVIGLWLRNRREDQMVVTTQVPVALRGVILVAGIGSLAIAGALFLDPDTFGDWWAWVLSPLTGRVLAGWFALAGTASLLLARERRVSAWLIPFEATIVWAVFMGAGTVRYDESFPGTLERTIFMGSAAVWIVIFLVAYAWLRRSAATEARSAAGGEGAPSSG